MMNEKLKNSRSKAGPDVPLGIGALVLGTLALLAHFAARVGLIREAPAFLFPIGVALFVSGYIACFALRRLYKRIEEIEHRIDGLTKGNAQEKKISEQP